MTTTTFAMPNIKDLSRYGIESHLATFVSAESGAKRDRKANYGAEVAKAGGLWSGEGLGEGTDYDDR
ncbi:hypothetical protein TNCV_91811 [Trichonephila clavipes]|nr:hypothetical protein TNCV_91811 [Trichonephila clavipes]